jgi:hypothetical protein
VLHDALVAMLAMACLFITRHQAEEHKPDVGKLLPQIGLGDTTVALWTVYATVSRWLV